MILKIKNINKFEEGQRLDNYLFNKYNFLPKSKIYSLIKKGKIRINKKRVKYFYKLKKNDILKIYYFYEKKKMHIEDINYNYNYNANDILNKKDILYENNDLIAINKKSGISVHGGTKNKIGLIEKLKFLFFKKNNFIELIHRLDKDTSGILLLAKNKIILRLLHKLFFLNKIYKEYIALVHGKWPKYIKEINNIHIKKKYILKNKNIKNLLKEKKCITKIINIKYINNFSLLKIVPLTGKKHQIRIHLSIYGYPIILDKRYGNFKLDKKIKNKIKIKRLFLHFKKIKFIHPLNNLLININNPLPNSLINYLYQIKNYGST